LSTKEAGSEIYAVSIATGGNVEVLSTEAHWDPVKPSDIL
jgi:hypothetical protein